MATKLDLSISHNLDKVDELIIFQIVTKMLKILLLLILEAICMRQLLLLSHKCARQLNWRSLGILNFESMV